VAGLRGALGRPEARETLRQLVLNEGEGASVLMLQETKLQTKHVAEVEAQLLDALPGDRREWRAAWSCSSERKGYAGVCTLWRTPFSDAALRWCGCLPLSVDDEHEAGREGRVLNLKLALAKGDRETVLQLVNVYTPNAGAQLQRLSYRTQQWDERFRSAVLELCRTRGELACVGGDMNVAVGDDDLYNPDERRVDKQAGTTPEERASMRSWFEPPYSFTDAYRALHPLARGQFTYWSLRARNRPRNRGLRLDYFLLSEHVPRAALLNCQNLHRLHGSDHCPVVLTLDLDALR